MRALAADLVHHKSKVDIGTPEISRTAPYAIDGADTAGSQPANSCHRPVLRFIGRAQSGSTERRERLQADCFSVYWKNNRSMGVGPAAPPLCYEKDTLGLQVVIARNRRMDWPDYLRDEAAKYRKLAETAEDAFVKEELLELAATCEDVANNIEDRKPGG
jgi:hypothetical protein